MSLDMIRLRAYRPLTQNATLSMNAVFREGDEPKLNDKETAAALLLAQGYGNEEIGQKLLQSLVKRIIVADRDLTMF
jgi:hypothetical protein